MNEFTKDPRNHATIAEIADHTKTIGEMYLALRDAQSSMEQELIIATLAAEGVKLANATAKLFNAAYDAQEAKTEVIDASAN